MKNVLNILFFPPKPAGTGAGGETNKGAVGQKPFGGMLYIVAIVIIVAVAAIALQAVQPGIGGTSSANSAPVNNPPPEPGTNANPGPVVTETTATPAETEQADEQNNDAAYWSKENIVSENNRAIKINAPYRYYQVDDIPKEIIVIDGFVINNLQVNKQTKQITGSVKYKKLEDGNIMKKLVYEISFQLYSKDRIGYSSVTWKYPLEGKKANDLLNDVNVFATYPDLSYSKNAYVVLISLKT